MIGGALIIGAWFVSSWYLLAFLRRGTAKPVPAHPSSFCGGCLEELEFDSDGSNICVQCGVTTRKRP